MPRKTIVAIIKKNLLLFPTILTLGCTATLSTSDTKVGGSSTIARACKPNQLNQDICLVDKIGSFIYDTEYGGRAIEGKSFLGANAVSKLSIPTGWYDGQTKVTFTESNLNSTNVGKIRLGKNLLGIEGTLTTSLPDECLNEQSSNCMVPATSTSTYYAYTAQYGGRTSLCAINSPSKLVSDCWIDIVNTRVNTTTAINDVDCSVEGEVAANCTARTTKYWYDAVDGGRNNCNLLANTLKGCWLDIPSGSVTLSSSSASQGATSDCVDARSSGFSSVTGCRTKLTVAPTWYVYNSTFGGRSSVCTADNNGPCFFKDSYDDVDTELLPENIKFGVKIFDVMGAFEGEGVWASSAHRGADVTQISVSSEAVSYRDKTNLPLGYRSIPLISIDDEGASSSVENSVLRLNWNSTCGTTGTITSRIADCASKFDFNATWVGSGKGNAGQGTWKLVTRAGNVSGAGIYREVWRDERTGLLWSSVVSKSLNWCQAAGVHSTDGSNFCNSATYQTQPAGAIKALSACYEGTNETSADSKIDELAKGKTPTNPLAVKWRIPTLYDYEVADYNGIRFVMPDMSTAGTVEWTGTTRSTDLTKAWVYDSRSGLSDVRTRTDATVVVRCIGDKGNQ